MKKRFISMLMAIIMVVSLGTVSASAITLVVDTAKVYKDDARINVDAYVDGWGEIYVESESDILKIFEDELEGVRRLPLTSLVVTDWASYYGYAWSQSDNVLYIYTDTTDPEIGDELIYDPDGSSPDDPSSVTSQTTASVYINGMKRTTVTGVTTYAGEAFVDSVATLKAIFPTEASKVSSTTTMPSSLRTWATQYKYTMTVSGSRVYLNNNGQTPIEMTLNGTLVDFPDQQPFVVAPGRTMVPIATLVSNLGFEVTWEGKIRNATHDRVKLVWEGKTMYLWIGVDQYWINGKYYKMDVAPYVLNGRTLVPIAFIGEALGFSVKWDGSTTPSTVRVTT